MATLTKIHPANEPLSYNSFRENNDNDPDLGTDHNTFTATTILNAKEPDTENQKGIISKVIFNDQLVHEDRFLMRPSTEMNILQIQTKYPPPDHVFTTYMIIPPGKTVSHAASKLAKNSLYEICRQARILVMGNNVCQERIPYGDEDAKEFEDILILGTLAEQLNYSELEFTHLGSKNYPKWYQLYQDQKKELDSDSEKLKGFLNRIYENSKDLDLENSDALVYPVDLLEDIVITMFANAIRLSKLTLTIKVENPEKLRKVLPLQTNSKDLVLEIKLNKTGTNTYEYTCNKPGDQSELNEMSSMMMKIMKSFFDLDPDEENEEDEEEYQDEEEETQNQN